MTHTTSIEALETKLDALLDTAIPSPRSEDVSYTFDSALHEITIYKEHWDKGTLKTYTVSYDKDGTICCDVDWETDTDGGYTDYRRLPKEVRRVCEELISLSIEIEALEEAQEEEGLTNSKDCDKASISEQEGSQVKTKESDMSIASMIYDEYNELEFDEETGFYGEG